MSTLRTAALVLGCTLLLGGAAAAISLVAPRDARADAPPKSLTVTLANGVSRTGQMTIEPLSCASTPPNGALLCQVTVVMPPAALPNAVADKRGQHAVRLGCTFFTHSVAEGRAVLAQLSDPSRTKVACADGAQSVPPGSGYLAIGVDLANVGSSQSFQF
jgi:hypothetical protein